MEDNHFPLFFSPLLFSLSKLPNIALVLSHVPPKAPSLCHPKATRGGMYCSMMCNCGCRCFSTTLLRSSLLTSGSTVCPIYRFPYLVRLRKNIISHLYTYYFLHTYSQIICEIIFSLKIVTLIS